MKGIILGAACLLAGFAAKAQRVFTPQELQADFTVIRQALEEAHPGLYRYCTREQMREHFGKVDQSLNKGMTELAFFRRVNPLLAAVRDGHTKFHRNGKPDDYYAFFEDGYFPLQLHFSNGKAYVLRSLSTQGLPPGTEVKSINGRKMGDITAHLFNNILADGDVKSARYEALNQFFPGYYAAFIGPAKEFKIRYKEVAGKNGTTTLPAVKADAARANQKDEPRYRLSFPKPNTALLRIAGFSNATEGPAYADFLAAVFRELKEQRIPHLIIDLRNNEGGRDAFGIALYAYLAKAPFRYYNRLTVAGIGPYSFAQHASFPREMEYLKQFVQKVGDEYLFTRKEGLEERAPHPDAFTGNVYILQNGRSYSVSAEFAAIAKDNRRAIFAGDESGGAFQGNTSGAFALVRLPNTGLELAVPLLGYYMQLQQPHPASKGIPADWPVSTGVMDIIRGRDAVLEETLKRIP